MDAATALHLFIRPTLSLLESKLGIARTGNAERMLLAIGGQESAWKARVQLGNGPARGWFQFELAGVRGVIRHPGTQRHAKNACDILLVGFDDASVYNTIAFNDALAATFARLLLFSDPRPLPIDESGAWDYYLRNWRPGKPRPEKWRENWKVANSVLQI